MLRGRSLKSRLARLAVAYAIALQGLLGAWGGVGPAHSVERDAMRSLCRTLAADDAPSDQTTPVHCVVMCLSGACSTGAPPAPATVTTEYAPRYVAAFFADEREAISSIAPRSVLGARGPPTIV
jgi:hypothetical protein